MLRKKVNQFVAVHEDGDRWEPANAFLHLVNTFSKPSSKRSISMVFSEQGPDICLLTARRRRCLKSIGGHTLPNIAASELGAQSMSAERRAQLYQNAVQRRDRGGQEVIDLIDSSGLPLRSGGMRNSDPAYLEMERIIWSEEGRKAALAATAQGLPALCGVEPLLKKGLGNWSAVKNPISDGFELGG
jgi:hypothetical protein